MALLDELLGQQGQSVSRGTPYQSGGVNPALMQLIASMTGPRMTPTPTPLAPGGSPADAALQAHIAGMPQQTFEPEPVPDAPQLWRRILAGLGDAATVYGSGLGAPIPIGNASGMLADINNQRLETMRANRKGQMATDTANQRQKWEAELQRLIAGKEAEGKAADLTRIKGEKLEERTYQEGISAKERQQVLDDAAADLEGKLKLEKLRGDYDLAQARIQQGQRNKDKVAETEAENLGKARAYIVALADQVPVMLAGGRQRDPRDPDDEGIPAMTADQIETRISRALDVIMGPTGDARTAANAYKKMVIDQIIDQYLQSEGQGPTGKAEVKPKALPRNDPGAPLRGFEGR